MELTNRFTVDMPIDDTWRALLDLPRIAPCLPGAAITEVDGEEYRGIVKIKVGPISAQYRGVATYLQVDEPRRHAVIQANGSDVGGQGNAQAVITVVLNERGSGTEAEVTTDLQLSGRVAQFGRGVISDVTSRILGQFATNLQAELVSNPNRVEAGSAPGGPVAPQQLDDVVPFNALDSIPVRELAKRFVPGALAGVGALIIGVLLRRRPSVTRAATALASGGAQLHLHFHLNGTSVTGTEGNE